MLVPTLNYVCIYSCTLRHLHRGTTCYMPSSKRHLHRGTTCYMPSSNKKGNRHSCTMYCLSWSLLRLWPAKKQAISTRCKAEEYEECSELTHLNCYAHPIRSSSHIFVVPPLNNLHHFHEIPSFIAPSLHTSTTYP